jgi:hypothetical protein
LWQAEAREEHLEEEREEQRRHEREAEAAAAVLWHEQNLGPAGRQACNP